MDAIGRLKELAPYEPLAAALLARVSMAGQTASTGLTVQRSPDVLPLYVRHPELAPVRFRRLARLGHGEPLARMLALFTQDSRPRTAAEISRETGLNYLSVRNVLTAGEHFQRDGVDGMQWHLMPQFTKEVSRASA